MNLRTYLLIKQAADTTPYSMAGSATFTGPETQMLNRRNYRNLVNSFNNEYQSGIPNLQPYVDRSKRVSAFGFNPVNYANNKLKFYEKLLQNPEMAAEWGRRLPPELQQRVIQEIGGPTRIGGKPSGELVRGVSRAMGFRPATLQDITSLGKLSPDIRSMLVNSAFGHRGSPYMSPAELSSLAGKYNGTGTSVFDRLSRLNNAAFGDGVAVKARINPLRSLMKLRVR